MSTPSAARLRPDAETATQPQPAPPRRLIGVREVAERYGCSERQVFRLADGGAIPFGCKLGALRRWDSDAIDAHIAAGCPNLRTTRQGRGKR